MTYEVWFFWFYVWILQVFIHKIKKYFEKVSKKQLIGPQKESFWGSILLNFTQLHWIHKKQENLIKRFPEKDQWIILKPCRNTMPQIWVDRNFNQQHIYGRWQSISDLLHSYNKLEKPKHICLNFREIFYQIKCTIFLSTHWYLWYPTLWKKSYSFQEKDKKNNFGPVCAIFAVNMGKRKLWRKNNVQGFSIFVILHFPA